MGIKLQRRKRIHLVSFCQDLDYGLGTEIYYINIRFPKIIISTGDWKSMSYIIPEVKDAVKLIIEWMLASRVDSNAKGSIPDLNHDPLKIVVPQQDI